jgi:hypothetical protein
MNLLEKAINPKDLFAIQNYQYQEKLILTDEVPAGSTRLGKVSITNLGHFLCTRITGNYETITDVGAGVINDDGVSHLRGKIIDQCTNRALTNDYVPLDLILTPGRVKTSKSANVLTDPASSAVFWPDEFIYLFTVNSDISIDVKNDGNTAIKYNICFHGWRFIRK